MGSRDRRKTGQVRWAFRSGVSGRGSWSRVEGTGSALTRCLSGAQSEGKLREGSNYVNGGLEAGKNSHQCWRRPISEAPTSHFTARPGWVALGMSPRLSGPRSLPGPEAAGKARKPQAGRASVLPFPSLPPTPKGTGRCHFSSSWGRRSPQLSR